MKAIKYHGHRALLNLPGHESTAAVVAEIEDTTGWAEGKDRNGNALDSWNRHPDYTFKLANCDRSIAFEFDLCSAESRANSFFKIDTMITALQKFRDGLEVEAREYRKRDAYLKGDEE